MRLRESGDTGSKAALTGPTQVWGALFASTATTVAIFLPVVFLPDEAGQLFADLALTIAIAVTASLIIAVTVIPAAGQQWLSTLDLTDKHAHWWRAATRGIVYVTDTPWRRVFWIALLLSIPTYTTYQLIPKADYLPEGNRNLVFAFIVPPPGVNIDHLEEEMGQVIADRIEPYLKGIKEPQIKNYFFVVWSGGVFMGGRATDNKRVDELVPVINQGDSWFSRHHRLRQTSLSFWRLRGRANHRYESAGAAAWRRS